MIRPSVMEEGAAMFGLPVAKPRSARPQRAAVVARQTDQAAARRRSDGNPVMPRYLVDRAGAATSSEQLSDEQLLDLANRNAINVSGTAPGSAELESARRRGLIDVQSPKEFERQLKIQIAARDRYYSPTWSDDDWARYQEEPTREVWDDITQAKWDEYVNREYVSYVQAKDADWDRAGRHMAALGKLGQGIGAVTAVFAGAFLIPIAAGPTSLIGGGASFTGAEIGTQAPALANLAAAGGGVAAAPGLTEKIEEALPLLEDAAAEIEEGFSATAEGLTENLPRVANFLTETTRPYTGQAMNVSRQMFQQAFSQVEEFVLQFEAEGSDLNRLRAMIVRMRELGERVPVISLNSYEQQIVNIALEIMRNAGRFNVRGPAEIGLHDILPYLDVVLHYLEI
jgi:hypothetical protein